MTPAREQAIASDASDPLAPFVGEFATGEAIYLDGHSLGPPSKRVKAAIEQANRHWASQLVRGWDHWIDLPLVAGDALAAAVLGAAAGQTVACDSTTINLHKLLGAALNAASPGRDVVVTDLGNFPTDRYAVDAVARAHGATVRWLADPLPRALDVETVDAALDGRVALVTFSAVDYRSGALADVPGITEAAHRCGALALWDLCHAAGVVPVDLDRAGVDLAVGCTYKYLNAGPGTPAWMYVADRHQERLASPLVGWFGQADQFAMGHPFVAAPGVRSWLAGTPPVAGLAAVSAAVSMVADAGLTNVRAKGVGLGSLACDVIGGWPAELGFTLASPSDTAARGSHIALRHPEAYRLSRALIDAGVLGDFRAPDLLRLGLSPLCTTFAGVYDALQRLASLADARAWERYDPERGRVT